MATRLPRERESKIQRSGIVRLGRLGIKLWRRNVASFTVEDRFIRCAEAGQADTWGLDSRGRHWEVEWKRPGNRPTEKQLAWLKEMTRRGAVAFWADSVLVAERVAEAILAGGRVVWHDDDAYDVDMNTDESEARR